MGSETGNRRATHLLARPQGARRQVTSRRRERVQRAVEPVISRASLATGANLFGALAGFDLDLPWLDSF